MDIIPPEILGEVTNLFSQISTLSPFLGGLIEFVGNWWWIPLPFILLPHFIDFYLKWRQHVWDVTERPPSVILEIRPPSEIQKPIRAME